MLLQFLQLIAGLAMLFAGGESLVRGSISIAKRFGVAPLIIGLTIVAYGTSAPELFVSMQAAFEGSSDIALGNVVGSNIANILLVVGSAAIIYPLVIQNASITKEAILLAIATTILIAYGFIFKQFDLFFGIIVVALLVAYTIKLIKDLLYNKKADSNTDEFELDEISEIENIKTMPLWLASIFVVAGIVILVVGSELLVASASEIALSLGISEAVIAVTIVAVGGSSPELVTSVMAAIKRHSDLAIGNVIGSNLFNILGALGLTSIVSVVTISDIFFNREFLILAGVNAIYIAILLFIGKFSRITGLLFLASYIIYVIIQYQTA